MLLNVKTTTIFIVWKTNEGKGIENVELSLPHEISFYFIGGVTYSILSSIGSYSIIPYEQKKSTSIAISIRARQPFAPNAMADREESFAGQNTMLWYK